MCFFLFVVDLVAEDGVEAADEVVAIVEVMEEEETHMVGVVMGEEGPVMVMGEEVDLVGEGDEARISLLERIYANQDGSRNSCSILKRIFTFLVQKF